MHHFLYWVLLFLSELDLYRGQEEIEQELQEKHQAKSGSGQFWMFSLY